MKTETWNNEDNEKEANTIKGGNGRNFGSQWKMRNPRICFKHDLP